MSAADGHVPDGSGSGGAGSGGVSLGGVSLGGAGLGGAGLGGAGLGGAGLGGAAVPGSVAEALAMVRAGAGYLAGPAVADLGAEAAGEALEVLNGALDRLAAVRAVLLSTFTAGNGHGSAGYGTPAGWLAARGKMTRRDARAAARWARRLHAHPAIAAALGNEVISDSWAREVAGWTDKLPDGMRCPADQILMDAAAGGADLEDLAVLMAAVVEQWRSGQPDSDEPDRLGDRYLALGTTIDGAGIIRGDLAPECAAAVQAVLEALGKKRGPEDTRSEGQRLHDALQEGCELLIRAKMVPARAGADTRVDVHIPLSSLRGMPGAAGLEAAWLAARAGQPGFLAGQDAQAAACDALLVPVVTGHPDLAVVDQMIGLVLAFLDGAATKTAGGSLPADGDRAARSSSAGGSSPAGGSSAHGAGAGTGNEPARGGAGLAGGMPADGTARPRPLPPGARDALRHAIARLAVDLVSGPDGLAAILRRGLLEAPFSSRSVPLDVGFTAEIPSAIRRAVILRDRHCAWPGCDKPPASCDVHHLHHKADGGPTSVRTCVLLCQFHHDICIHRWGWALTLHPDGTTEAHGPRGQVLRSHAPPGTAPPGTAPPGTAPPGTAPPGTAPPGTTVA